MNVLFREKAVGESFSIFIKILPNSYTRKRTSLTALKFQGYLMIINKGGTTRFRPFG